MNIVLILLAWWIALAAYIFNVHMEPSVYACSEVTKKDPADVQKICERERRGKWWMK
jgi:hypothetical protein